MMMAPHVATKAFLVDQDSKRGICSSCLFIKFVPLHQPVQPWSTMYGMLIWYWYIYIYLYINMIIYDTLLN